MKKKRAGVWILALALLLVHLVFRSTAHAEENQSWKQMFLQGGLCKISFPVAPKKVQEILSLPKGNRLLYDIYTAPLGRGATLFFLTTTFSSSIAEKESLEDVVHAILERNKENKLIFSKENSRFGQRSISFLIQSKTHYFRGEVIAIQDKLFILGMDGNKDDKKMEEAFGRFVESFQFE